MATPDHSRADRSFLLSPNVRVVGDRQRELSIPDLVSDLCTI